VGQDFGRYDGRGDGTGDQMGAWDQFRLDIVSDITAIPEPDESFDAILCTEVLEHVPDPVEALRELARLLKKGGYIILTAPFCSASHFSPFHFSSGFNRYWYQFHLKELGFEIIEIVANGNFFEYVASDIRTLSTSAIRYCSKSVSSFFAVTMFFLSLPLLWMVHFAAKHETNSAELACHGYHVFARRL
jgi:ubiquinone/menaquinone biosynthesis C-methylase UbiE